jgi:DNA polymerase phi
MASYRDAIYQTLLKACEEDEASLNAVQIKQILKAALQAMRQTRRIASDQAELCKLWAQDDLLVLGAAAAKSDKFKKAPSIQRQLQQLVTFLGPPQQNGILAKGASTSKRKAPDGEADMEAAGNKKGKREKSKKSKGV